MMRQVKGLNDDVSGRLTEQCERKYVKLPYTHRVTKALKHYQEIAESELDMMR